MKQILLFALVGLFISINGWSTESTPGVTAKKPIVTTKSPTATSKKPSGATDEKLPLKSKASNLKVEKKLPAWHCFEVTYYLTCGYVWGGEHCVYQEGSVLSSETFAIGWRFKNLQLCGVWVVD